MVNIANNHIYDYLQKVLMIPENPRTLESFIPVRAYCFFETKGLTIASLATGWSTSIKDQLKSDLEDIEVRILRLFPFIGERRGVIILTIYRKS